MGIESLHPIYNQWSNSWTKCRDAYDGQAAVKKRGEAYLPKLKGQDNSGYRAYKGRALFYSITSKTVGALLGLAIGKPPEIDVPDKMKYIFEERSGTEFYEVLCSGVSENLLMGRIGVMVDRPESGGDPFLRMYVTESIINWDHDDSGKLNYVILKEIYTEPSKEDKYEKEVKVRYRELFLNDEGIYQVRVWLNDGKGSKFEASSPVTPTNTGKPMDYIPFFCANPFGLSFDPHKPPMLDIVDINLSHYRSSADLEHGRHFTGLPQPYITGAETDTALVIGQPVAWVIPSEKASVGYLEFTGQGLGSLERAMSEKQAQLASLSARLMDNNTRGSEAAETVRLRYMSETASLKSIVRSVEALLNTAYTCISDMMGLGPVSIKLNTDFLDSRLAAKDLNAWVDAYLSGGVSKEIFLHALRRGDSLPPPGQPIGDIPGPAKQKAENLVKTVVPTTTTP